MIDLYENGLVALSESRNKDALECFLGFLRLEPRHFHALYFAASLEEQMSFHGSSIRHCKQALRINPNSGQLWRTLGKNYMKTRHYRRAITCFRHANQYDEKVQNHVYLSSIYLRIHDYHKALKAARLAIRMDSGFGEGWLMRGIALRCRGKTRASLSSVRRAFRCRESALESALFEASLQLLKLGRPKASRRAIIKSLRSDAYNPGAIVFGDYIACMTKDHALLRYIQRHRDKTPVLKDHISHYSHLLRVYLDSYD